MNNSDSLCSIYVQVPAPLPILIFLNHGFYKIKSIFYTFSLLRNWFWTVSVSDWRPHCKMDLNNIKDQVSNLTLYDIKAGFRKAQNGTLNRPCCAIDWVTWY